MVGGATRLTDSGLSITEWKPVSGTGKLLSWVKFHRAYWDGFKDDLPYDACLVQLDECPRVVSNFAND